MRIESKAPTRIDLAGGTLDIWPLYLFHEGALTVNCAITRMASCVIELAPKKSPRIVLASRDTKRRESFASLAALERATQYELPLLARLVRRPSPALGGPGIAKYREFGTKSRRTRSPEAAFRA